MAMAKNPVLDETTRRIAERILNTPPKPHKEMKLGKRKPKAAAKVRPPKKR
jgi:hypothetical protein